MSTPQSVTRIPTFGYCFSPVCPRRADARNCPHSYKQCSACRMIAYCSQECQKKDWHFHKKFCNVIIDKPRVKAKAKQAFLSNFSHTIGMGTPVFSLHDLMKSSCRDIQRYIYKCITLIYVTGHMKCGSCHKYVHSIDTVDSHITFTRLSSTGDLSTLFRAPGLFDPTGSVCLARMRVDVRCTSTDCVKPIPPVSCDENTTQLYIFSCTQDMSDYTALCFTAVFQIPTGHYLIRNDCMQEVVRLGSNLTT
jgi:hypothetical protein